MSSKCGLVVIFITIAVIIVNGNGKEISRAGKGNNRLNEYISHHETLSYDDRHLHASHNRAKRSVTKDHHVYLRFKAHGKDFHLRLKRDLTTFSDKLEVHSSSVGPVSVDTSHIYQGDVIGEPKSHVFGSIINGVFEGKIITERDAYYVEHAKYYFPNHTHGKDDFHSVIYHDKDVEDPYRDVREGHVGGCGITEEVSQWMQNIQNSAVEEPEELPVPMSNGERSSTASKSKQSKNHPPKKYQADMEFHQPHEKYTKEANFHETTSTLPTTTTFTFTTSSSLSSNRSGEQRPAVLDEDWHRESHERVRRASAPRPREDNKNTCSLYIQTDPLIWRHIKEGIVDNDRVSKRNEIDHKTREEILSLIAHHVTAVNYIYRNTKFDGRNEHRNIRFEVQRIKIDDDSACKQTYNGPHNAFCNEHMDVSNFLNLHSLEDHGDFCLAYVFTYRDFTGGTLGLAWVASASGASGGICEKYKTYTETVGGQYQSTKRSLNTGIITFVNYNSRVPPKVSQLTLAHEIGHNFGSPHDYPQDCRPGGVNGNFIMFASATSGDRPNNSKFSQCSIRNISNVLDALVGNPKRDCFNSSEGAFCGNKIVEVGEECDCGFNEDECKDKCCYPRLISEYDMSLNSSAKGCTRRALTQCSPSQGACCLSDSCTFVPAHYHMRCKEETECSWSSTCNGTTAECPDPKPRDDKTKCNNGTQLCVKGECSGSICLLWNLTECFLTSQNTPNIDKRRLCELACQNGSDPLTCRSTSEFAHLYNLPEGGISLRPGAPCDNFQGYCDVFLKCRAIDAEGPLVRLKNLLLNKETLSTLAQWITENWYAVVLMGIGFIIFMGIFIKCCAVHTPSSNPKKRAAIRLSDTLRGPMTTLRRMRHHPHSRGAGPRSIPPPSHERSRSGGDRRNADRGGGGVGAGGGRGDGGRRPRNGGGGGHAGRPSSSSRSAGPQSGYGDGRGYYPPKAVAPPVNYNGRPTSLNNPELYAEAYQGRGAYDVALPPLQQPHAPNSKV